MLVDETLVGSILTRENSYFPEVFKRLDEINLGAYSECLRLVYLYRTRGL